MSDPLRSRAASQYGRRPNRLRPSDRYFTGRTAEKATLRDTLLGKSSSHRRARVAAVYGAPGVGKTTLALEVANSIQAEFPDGALELSLSHPETNEVLSSVQAQDRLLRQLGFEDTPEAEELAREYFNEALQRRQVLILLDNASSAAQVRSLIPHTDACAVLITSRAPISVGADVNIQLLGMKPVEALDLLAEFIGWERIEGESKYAQLLVRQCGYSPLAISLVGARIDAELARESLKSITEELSNEKVRLDFAEDVEDDRISVRACFATSYRALKSEQRLVFRRLALLACAEFSSWVAGPPSFTGVEDTPGVISG